MGNFVIPKTTSSPTVPAGGTFGQILAKTNEFDFNTQWINNTDLNAAIGTGTINYLSKFTGSNTLGNSLLFDNGTNVGIGTVTPASLLDVNGQVLIGNGNKTQQSTFPLYISGSTGLGWKAAKSDGTAVFELYAGFSGINEVRLLNNQDLAGYSDSGTTNKFKFFGATGNGYFAGNVGIGTTTPGYKLDVNGTLRTNDRAYIGEDVTFTSSQYHYLISGSADGLVTFTNNTVTQGQAQGLLTGELYLAGTAAFLNHRGINIITTNRNTNTSNIVRAFYASGRTGNTGAANTVAGFLGGVNIEGSGNVTNAIGLEVEILSQTSNKTITNMYGVKVQPLINSVGTITNTYGLYIDSLTAGTQTNAAYGIYQSSATNKNYFAGNVGIGTTTPGNMLDIGSVTNGGDVSINGTESANLLGPLSAAGWSLGTGWIDNGNGTLTHNGTTSGNIVSLAPLASVVAGAVYKTVVTIASTKSSAYIFIGGYYSYTFNSITGTLTFYTLATTTTAPTITAAGNGSITISSISIKRVTNGDLLVYGKARFANAIYNAFGQKVIDFNSSGKIGLAGADASNSGYGLTVNGHITVGGSGMYAGFFGSHPFFMYMDGTNKIANFRSEAAGSSPVTIRAFTAYTDVNNYERMALTGVAGVSVNLKAETAGTGGDNLNIVLTPAGTGYTLLNGNVGIGTITPAVKLEVYGTNELLRFGDGTSGNDAFISFNSRGYIGFQGAGGLNFIANAFRPIIFGIGSNMTPTTEWARFGAFTGNFSIGASGSGAVSNFQVAQNTTGFGTVATNATTTLTGTGTQFSNTFKVGDTITVSGETIRTIATIVSDVSLTVTVAFTTTASALTYTLIGGSRFNVFGNGQVGIGTGSVVPTARLQVKGDGTNPIVRFETSTSAIAQQFYDTSMIGFGNVNPIYAGIYGHSSIDPNAATANSLGVGLLSNQSSTTASYGFGIKTTNGSNAAQWITGTGGLIKIISSGFIPSAAGNGNYRNLEINYSLNGTNGAQTGTATGIYLNATETALNGMVHNLMDLQIGGVSKFSVRNDGRLNASGSIISLGDVATGALSYLGFTGRTVFSSPSNGVLLVTNNAVTDFSRMMLGGATNLYPAIGRSSTALTFILADNSGYAQYVGRLINWSTAVKNAASNLAAGLIVYDTTLNKLSFYNGTTWETVTSG